MEFLNKISSYKKVPVEIQAVQYCYPASDEIKEWLGDSYAGERAERSLNGCKEMTIKTLEDGMNDTAKHVASQGDFIIKGIHGEFYACKPDIFYKTHQKVT